ncbi:MAG: cell division protein FtsK [Bacteroidetes bacterium]|nr:MAG: cell division protein FtsK [Bacteroidota bacterium]
MAKKKVTPKSDKKFDISRLQNAISNRSNHFVLGLSLMAFALFLMGAFISYLYNWTADQSLVRFSFWSSLSDPQIQANNLFGKFGAALAHQFIFEWFGLAAFLFCWYLTLIGLRFSFKLKLNSLRQASAAMLFFLIWIPSTLAYFIPSQGQLAGATGYWLEAWLSSLTGPIGTIIILIITLLLFLSISNKWTGEIVLAFFRKFKPQKLDKETESRLETSSQEAPASKARPGTTEAESSAVIDQYRSTADAQEEEIPEETAAPEAEIDLEIDLEIEEKTTEETTNDIEFDVEADSPVETPSKETEVTEEVIRDEDFEIYTTETEEELTAREVKRKLKEFGEYDPTLELARFKAPPLELLKDFGSTNIIRNDQELAENKNKIVETLNNYKIEISKIKATIGPTVTLYEIVPAPGVRISKIKNLEDDIALSLAALGIRIIAPIPGKGTIGIEVPSTNPQVVPMRNLIASEKFQKNDMELPIAFGKTISNETYVADLAKMPHLLMAGATGQGKSVGLNVILTSLLYKKHPSQVKFVLVDPKKVELTLFNKIERHYLAKLPDTEDAIITDTTKVIHTLNSLCIEMDQRYDLLKDAMVRNIKEYNAKFIQRRLNPEQGHRYLPYIVLVIDEFADLIMTAGKEVETPIARLAQLARAIGIHLIVATQRPSVNVITGIIKANFPARVAFRVTSKIDSRTILDAGGAEQLIGKGDMLLSQGSDLIRLQCAFVDTPEVEEITDFIGNQQAYPEAYQLPEYKGADEDGNVGVDILDPSERDVLFNDAARLVVISQQGSASMLQRKLKLGYNRAGRIVDQLESAGIIGHFEGSKAREVLIPDEHSLEQLLNHQNKSE